MDEPLGFSRYTVISLANSDSLASLLLIWMPFLSFSCLIALPIISSTMLTRSGESEHPFQCSSSQGECFQLFPIQYNAGGGFVIDGFITLRYFSSMLILLRDAGFCQMLFLHLLR